MKPSPLLSVGFAGQFLKKNFSFLANVVLFLSLITIMFENRGLEDANYELRKEVYNLHGVLVKIDNQMYWDGYGAGFDDGYDNGRQDEKAGRPDPT